MAQTKRKRRTKHRGNAAGMVETRGRTGRPPTAKERASQRSSARANRFDHPPTWRSAFNRAIVAVVIFVAAVTLVLKQPVLQGLALGAFMLLIYVPMGYYTDLVIYRRRQAKKQKASSAGKGE